MSKIEKTPEFLYHYTSVDVLLKLIESIDDSGNMIFRASHIRYLNDWSEYDVFESKLRQQLIEYDKNTKNPIGEDAINEKDILLLKPYTIHPCVISLSTKNDFLPMWSMYGDNCRGVIIAFKYDELYNNATKCKYGIAKCDYFAKEESTHLNDEIIKSYYEQLKCSPHKMIPSEYSFNGMDDSLCWKYSDFDYEDEWRIFQRVSSKYKSHSPRGTIKLYTEIQIPLEAVKKIILAPAVVNFELTRKAITELFDLKKKSIDIEKSSIPYRII